MLSIEEKIKESIDELENFSKKIPGVFIVHDLRDWAVKWMSENGLKHLGVTLNEITSLTADEYYGRFFNVDDTKESVPKILGLLERNNDNEFCTYFQQVRFPGREGWNWHIASTKIFLRDNEGKPLLTLTTAFPIDTMQHIVLKAEKLLQENNFIRKHYHQFDSLTKREREILQQLASGKSTSETATSLFISEHTVETHKKNIRQKLNANSMYELSEYARAFDLI